MTANKNKFPSRALPYTGWPISKRLPEFGKTLISSSGKSQDLASRVRFLRGHIISGSLDISDGLLVFEEGKIIYSGPTRAYPSEWPITAKDPDLLLMPGLVDLHCHGALGGDFSTGEIAAGRSAAGYLHRQGTTTLLASVVTGPPDALISNLMILRTLADEGLIAGSHLEGPFLSPHQCGAHDAAHLQMPSKELAHRLINAAGRSLVTVTVSPDLPGALDLVDLLAARGVIPSLGHTSADGQCAADFLARAADQLLLSKRASGRTRPTVTHLFNAMPPLHHRAFGPVGASLSAALANQVVVELIGDGTHIEPAVVKLTFDILGAQNVALVSDSMAATGLPDGNFQLGRLDVSVNNGVARLDGTNVIAGGTSTLLEIVRTSVAAGVPLRDALTSASKVPAAILGLSDNIGDLLPGMKADVVLTNRELDLRAVVREGELLSQ